MSEMRPIIDPAGKAGINSPTAANETLDPEDWSDFRAQAHRMLDDMLGYIEKIRERPVWRPIPEHVPARRFALPRRALGEDLAQVHAEFMREVLPYAQGNVHPGFMGWVQWRRHAGGHGGGDAGRRG
jgi:aromatic-L-amino-acid decarboxylase